MKKLSLVLLATFALAACALDQPIDETTTGAHTLTSDFGDVIVVGAQLPSGDNFSQAFLPEDLTVPVATYRFSVSTGVASWAVGEIRGSTEEIPLSESLETANWMAYEVWAAANGISLGESPYGCSCRPCSVGGAPGVCCTWPFGSTSVSEK